MEPAPEARRPDAPDRGVWHTGVGLRPSQVLDAMPATMRDVAVEGLSGNALLWGAEVTDERFVVSATRA